MRIGWIGNSYVYFNDLPTMLASMLDESYGLATPTHEQVTPGGWKLIQHAEDERTHALIGKPWDVLVLQDHSCGPGGAVPDELARTEELLQNYFAKKVAAPQILIYGSWGHRQGSVYPQCRNAYPDYATMQAKTTEGCARFVSLCGPRAQLVPVGDAFRRIYEEENASGQDPQAEESLFRQLFAPDDFHPSRLGSYLAACTFAYVLTGTSPVGTSFRPAARCAHDEKLIAKGGAAWEPKSMSDAEVKRLQEAAAWAVELHLSTGDLRAVSMAAKRARNR